MVAFLSAEWFDDLNSALGSAGPMPVKGYESGVRVVLEFPDAPSSVPHAVTFTIDADGASLTPGDNLAADAVIGLAYADAVSLTNGQFDSAAALREGRVKVRGDINAIVPLLAWLQAAHPKAGQ